MDAFTKYIFTYPLKSSHPKFIVAALTQIFTNFGQPALFVADNGSEFHNWEVVNFLKLWGVQWNFIAPYNPQANGQAEAGVKIISSRLRLALIDFLQRCAEVKPTKVYSQWPALLPYVTAAYNACPIEALDFSPFEMVFGRSPRLPVAVPIDESQINSPTRAEAAQYLKQLVTALTHAHRCVEEKTSQRRTRMADAFNSRRSPLMLEAGDHVYITHPYSIKPKKLEPRARGPYKVIKVTHHPTTQDVVSVEVDVTPPGSEQKVSKWFPRRRLRPIRSRLPTIDWKNWPENNESEENVPDLADLLNIKEAETDPPTYVAFEDDVENAKLCEEYILDILELQPDSGIDSKKNSFIALNC